METIKKVIWMGNTLEELKKFPEAVKDSIGYALQKVQEGVVPHNSKQLKGISPTVMEIISNYNNDTYRAVYTIKISKVVYVLHCFQKKSKRGIKTPKQDVDLIKKRLSEAKSINHKILERVK
ncbi:MAG: hypothetical protein GY821_13020 [Gammaproteobacteria bacterium]|nr:hypothetical protein [Gammaproteobacteria bacterium]